MNQDTELAMPETLAEQEPEQAPDPPTAKSSTPTGWQKGQSGNPAGRAKGSKNKLTKEQLRSAKEHFEPMLGMAAGIVSHHLMGHAPVVSEDENGELVMEGMVRDCPTCRHFVTLVYDYAFGKPSQSVTVRGDDAAPLHVLATARYEGWASPQQLPQPAEHTLPPPTPPTTPPEAEPGPEGAGSEG